MKRETTIGGLRDRVRLEENVRTPDGAGGFAVAWQALIERVPAEFLYLRGGETVTAARLEARRPMVVRVGATAATRSITPDHRLVDLASDDVLNIRAIELSRDRRFVEILAEGGVAA